MAHEKSTLDELITTLKQERDQLAVKMNLAGKEARQEWDKMRAKFDKLLNDYEPVRKAVGDSAGAVGESLKKVAQECKSGFERIRKSLT